MKSIAVVHCSALDYVAPQELQAMGIKAVAVSLLNLLQRPGWEWLINHGGLHRFLAWEGLIFSDMTVSADEDLVEIIGQNQHSMQLRSRVDGQKISLELAKIVEVQHQLGIADLPLEATYYSTKPQIAARQGELFTAKGILQIQQADYTLDFSRVDDQCCCYTCCNFTRAYLRHVYFNVEMLAIRLMTIHNIFFMTTKIPCPTAFFAGGARLG